MRTRKVRIVLNPIGQQCLVELDGQVVENVRAVGVQAEVGKATLVNLQLINVEVVVDGDIEDPNLALVDVTPISADKRAYALIRSIAEDKVGHA